ncbi:MAG: DEAD/DEAH box helicase family protein [Verrucomicrobiales bacterium]|jgi:superfamily II DNA or RNA helicase|nr:DEAD/DEAH box helicase family protein [Verrucomicrobiales bacterium]
MKLQTPVEFQKKAIGSGVALFTEAARQLDIAADDEGRRATVVKHNGYLLIEAPTGSGKTLMAGNIIENFSREEKVVWFWFAPFKGVVGQTAAFLREQCAGLRLRDLAHDRSLDNNRAGDVFVTTWQTVATRVTDRRNLRRESESNPSVDTLTVSLREQGFRLGVVVDEAHHGFGKDTQAAKFFHEILRPDYCILVTATPDDRDVREFEKALGIAELHRVSVSRADAVDAGLIKRGVKCMAYFVEETKRSLVDLPGTALRDAIRAHRQLKARLAELKIPLTPLLLVQAGNGAREVENLRQRLLELGFAEKQIATHTAEEPDAGLLALANDEQREVLIFKMAVALGFDAPRAFTLVSTRASRDADFGVQLVGRILRTHRLLQARARNKTLPDELAHGYVFLADPKTQTGLDEAGQRINQIQTAYATVSNALVRMNIGAGTAIVSGVEHGGQTDFVLQGETQHAGFGNAEHDNFATTVSNGARNDSFDFGAFFDGAPKPSASATATGGGTKNHNGNHCCSLRGDVPRKFKSQEAGTDNAAIEEECANLFKVSTRALFEALKNKVSVEKRTLEIFTGVVQQEFKYAADVSPEHAALIAQKFLLKNQLFDARELRRVLLQKMREVMREEAMPQAGEPETVASFLDVIIAAYPDLLRNAQKEATARHMEIVETEELPKELQSDRPLTVSPRNVYGVMPPNLNTWERLFVEKLDREPNNIVAWWHRNEPHEPWSVNVLRTDGKGFFPDFIIGINGRRTEDKILLVDTKRDFTDKNEAPKVLAEHRVYGRAMILYLNDDTHWFTVTWDSKINRPVAEQEFRLADMAGFA